MLVFKVHQDLMMEMLALAAGTALLMWAHKEECCRKFYKAMGYFILVVTFLTMICTVYQAFRFSCQQCSKYHEGGMRDHEMMEGMGMMRGMGPHGMMGDGMGMHGKMMKEMMEECPMIKDCPMMKKMMGEQSPESSPSPDKK